MSAIQAGEAPLWNPYRGAGQPLLANPNSLVLHPTTLLFFVLPFQTAFKAGIILQIFLAGAGMWLLLRDMGESLAGSFLGATLFAFSGYMVSLGNLINILDSAAWMPLSLWLTGRAMARGFAPWGSLAALSLAVQVAAGEPAVLICTGAALAALHGSSPHPTAGRPARSTKAGLACLIGVALLALAISMVALLPAVELLVRSERGAGFDRTEALKWSLPPPALLETLIPRLFGDPTRTRITQYWGGGLFDAGLPLMLSLYLGPGALILAGFGILAGFRAAGPRRLEAVTLGCAALLGVGLALGRFLPLYPALLAVLPPLHSVRYPVKYFLLTTWAVSLLAARGYDGLSLAGRHSAGGFRRAKILAAFILAIFVLHSAGRWLGLYHWLASRHLGISPVLASGGVLQEIERSIASSVLAMGLYIAIMLVSVAFHSLRTSRFLLVATPIVSLLLTVASLNPVAPASFYSEPPALQDLARQGEVKGRLWAAPRPKGFAFRTPRGEEPDSLRWGFRWDRMTLRNATYFPHRYHFAYDRGNERLDVMPGAALGRLLYEGAGDRMPRQEMERLLSVAAVDRIISYGGLQAPEFQEVGRLEGESNIAVVVVRNDAALPRAYVATQVEIRPDIGTALKRLRDPSFDPSRAVILEEGSAPSRPAQPGATAREASPAGTAEILQESASRVTVKSSSDAAGYLVLADTFYPGWEATVDGEEATVVRANAMFRAVAVPGGTHEVQFIFRSGAVRSGTMVTAAALLLAGLLSLPRRG